MNSFQAIKANLTAYSSIIASVDDDLLNERLIQSAILQLTQFKDSFSTVDLPPVRIEMITTEDRSEVVAIVKQIAERFYKRMGLNEHIVILWNVETSIEVTISALIAETRIGALTSLSTLAKELEECAAQVSLKISHHVESYRQGQMTPKEAEEALEILSSQLILLKNHLISTKQKLSQLAQITNDWIQHNKRVPKDFIVNVKTHISTLYEGLAKISSSLVHEAEQLHPALNLLHIIPDTSNMNRINPSYCVHGRRVLEHFQTLNAFMKSIQQYLSREDPSWTILLYNIYHLELMIEQGDKMFADLPKKVETSMQYNQTSLNLVLSIMTDDIDPSIDEKQRLFWTKRRKNFEQEKQHLTFTQTHLEEISNHPTYLDAKKFILQLRSEPRTSIFFEDKPFPSPLGFKSNFWLLENLQLSDWKDVKTFYHSLEKYSKTFFSLHSIFRGRSEERTRKRNPSPWLELTKLDELTSKLGI